MIKRIIFDIDDTLITGVSFDPYVKNSFIKYGVEPKVKEFEENCMLYEKLYKKYDKDTYAQFYSDVLGQDLGTDWVDILLNELQYCIPRYSNLDRVLDNLSDYELVLLSNYFEESQRNRLKNMGIDHYFSKYYGESSVKPNREAYIEAIGTHLPSECVIVGDNELLDVKVPREFGLKTIFINNKSNWTNGLTLRSVEEVTPKLLKKIK